MTEQISKTLVPISDELRRHFLSIIISPVGSGRHRADKLACHPLCSLRDGDPQPSLLDATASSAGYGL